MASRKSWKGKVWIWNNQDRTSRGIEYQPNNFVLGAISDCGQYFTTKIPITKIRFDIITQKIISQSNVTQSHSFEHYVNTPLSPFKDPLNHMGSCHHKFFPNST